LFQIKPLYAAADRPKPLILCHRAAGALELRGKQLPSFSLSFSRHTNTLWNSSGNPFRHRPAVAVRGEWSRQCCVSQGKPRPASRPKPPASD